MTTGTRTARLELPGLTSEDRARFDFIEGVKLHNYRHHVRPAIAAAARAVERAASDGEAEAAAEEAVWADVRFRVAASVQNASQKMMWTAGRASLHGQEAAIARALDAALGSSGVGSLELDPDIELPEWYEAADIHLQEGGYFGHPVVGAIYERSGPLYRTSWRRAPASGALEAFARSAPGTSYARILDLGCSFGTFTAALRTVYPEADNVTGIDLSAAALKWAHLRTAEAGLDIDYRQRDAASTGFDDGSFDLVAAYLLLHEVPTDVTRAIVAEAFRVLAPGGHLMFLDIPPFRALPPERRVFHDFDTWGNGEPYWGPYARTDLADVVRSEGFDDVREGPLGHPEPGFSGAGALMRTGDERPENRWTTRGDKPRGEPPGPAGTRS